ncbi:MAG: DMT family transporter [Oligoflexia bacterium]|nr:DMT family transporter [Oligoflexia bacterium]
MKLKNKWIILGPLFVILGAGMWGTESFFRVNLNRSYDPEILVFIEHLFCIAFTLPLLFLNKVSLKKIPRKAWIYLILSGSVGSAIGTTFFTMSLKELNPSVANVLLNFQPIVCVLFAMVLLKEKPGRGFSFWAIFALLCGGVIATNNFNISDFTWSIGLLYITITALAWGFSTVAGRGAMIHIPLTVATAGRFIIGAFTLFVSLAIKGKLTSENLNWPLLSQSSILQNFLLLSFVAGVIPLFFYFKGLSKTSASVAGFCELTQTFIALLLTWGVLGQPLTSVQVFAGILLLVAVYKININFARANKQY